MTTEAGLTAAAAGKDPALGLRAVRALRELADRLEALLGRQCARTGLGLAADRRRDALDISRQAAHKKYGRRVGGERIHCNRVEIC